MKLFILLHLAFPTTATTVKIQPHSISALMQTEHSCIVTVHGIDFVVKEKCGAIEKMIESRMR